MENMNQVARPPRPLPELIASLEQAAVMAKQLPATLDQAHLLQIYSSLNQAHHHLSSFLSSSPPPPLPIPAAANSFSSATGFANGGSEPMQTGEDDGDVNGADENSAVEKMEERMRDCFIKNKRRKRPLWPMTATVKVEERRVREYDGFVDEAKSFDPRGNKLRALDLVYQFHG